MASVLEELKTKYQSANEKQREQLCDYIGLGLDFEGEVDPHDEKSVNALFVLAEQSGHSSLNEIIAVAMDRIAELHSDVSSVFEHEGVRDAAYAQSLVDAITEASDGKPKVLDLSGERDAATLNKDIKNIFDALRGLVDESEVMRLYNERREMQQIRREGRMPRA